MRQDNEVTIATTHDPRSLLAEGIESFQEMAGIEMADKATHALLRPEHVRSFEARAEGVGFFNFADNTRHQNCHEFRFRRALVGDQRLAFDMIRREWEGKPYAFGQLLGIGAWILLRKFGIKTRLATRRLTVCSELVHRYVEKLGGPEWESLREFAPDRDKFFPPHLLRWCRENPDLLDET